MRGLYDIARQAGDANHRFPRPGLARKLCAFSVPALVFGCSGPGEPEPVIPALPDRAAFASCLAGVEIPADPDTPVEFPVRLSDTGCFEDLASGAFAADLIPFRVNTPLWTDGVHKQRLLAIPPGDTIGFTETGAWVFPERSVLLKQFILEAEVGVAESRRPVETRLMLRNREGWAFASYRWNEAGTEASFGLDPVTVAYEVIDGDTARTIDYEFPSEMGCHACHADVTGEALGPRTAQLNRTLNFETGRQNQLAAMAAIGLFDTSFDPDALPRYVDPADEDEPLEDRARSWLHANCAHCHMPGGYNSTVVDVDLRIETPLADARACGEPIHHTIHIGNGALVIDPGRPDNSNAYGRMLSDGISKMPPLGRSIPDPLGLDLVRQWIEGMPACP